MLNRLKEEILIQEEQEFQAFALENILSEDVTDDEIEQMILDDIEDEEALNESSDLDVYQEGDLSEDVSLLELADDSEEKFLESVEEELREGGFYNEDVDLYLEDEDYVEPKKTSKGSDTTPLEDTDLDDDDDLNEDFVMPNFNVENDSTLSEIHLLEVEDFE